MSEYEMEWNILLLAYYYLYKSILMISDKSKGTFLSNRKRRKIVINITLICNKKTMFCEEYYLFIYG